MKVCAMNNCYNADYVAIASRIIESMLIALKINFWLSRTSGLVLCGLANDVAVMKCLKKKKERKRKER